MAHLPAWLTELNEYIKDRGTVVSHEFNGPNRKRRRDRSTTDGPKLPLAVIGKPGFTQPGAGKRWHQ